MKGVPEDERQSVFIESPLEQSKKRKKKRSTLTSARSSNGGYGELSWINNSPENKEPRQPVATEPFSFLLPKDIQSLDDIYERFHHGYYHAISALENALILLFTKTVARCRNTLAINYLESVKA